jgi:uncharacterized membrane protein YjjB (DUF3815 family)
MTEIIIKLIASACASLGFAVIFQANVRHLPAITVGGTITAAIYILLDLAGTNLFVSSFVAVAMLAILSEIFARIFRAPTAIFLLPGTIILFPGGSLYYAMSGLILKDLDLAASSGKAALLIGLGIAGGMIAGSVVCGVITRAIDKWRYEKLKAGKK